MKLAALLFLVFLAAGTAQGFDPPAPPAGRPDGAPWRIGYYQGGDYKDYAPVLRSILQGLHEDGWMPTDCGECFDPPRANRDVWACLSASDTGPWLRFAPDAFWSSEWDKTVRPGVRRAAIGRLKTSDLDLVLAMGTWAGQDLANNEHHVPILVASSSNPVSAGIIKSASDSGFDHVHARVDPTRYARQIRLFHKLAGFKRLGVVFEDTPEGRTYAGMDQIAPLAAQQGFAIVECHAPFSGVDLAASKAAVLECHRRLASEVDAFYLTTHRGVAEDNLQELLAPLLDRRIPVFAMGTDFEVRRGALLSMAQPDFYWCGAFYSRTLTRILAGAAPRSLPQIFEDPHKLAINLNTARRIQFHIPVEYLAEATLHDAEPAAKPAP
ncbi:hypothetical protein NNJEOMEG_02318 [Fundidesulfovibrio magnetotacticus]|uniref:ABC transporter substrate-binding protein n=1 Tax=Fundidesulfovibrio magnetotacticus TaxID=2730080 RepID=A0A6V8LPG7_9BACT|nr:ABC transporter substrate binding protein [Fundidesulfovibrio magnetotacticus]GFK94473.1 hypothetical protein NNJEOMEG_02318 [Fundidesulfovibrio magnetotacticus]